jgi:TonB-dependent receptor
MKVRQLPWLIRAAFALPVIGTSAMAQEAPSVADTVQQVTVSGIRASVRNALEAKEASNSFIEVIASEDIGKLPDTTIAESLARLPGMNSGIDRGNASQVVARGLGPRFIGATLDGRELATPEPNRAVRFEQFPSESLVGATVYKTQSAELVEGGVATTIDLLTVSPLKFKERQVTLKADALYYPMGRDFDGPTKGPRLGALWLDQFNNRTLGLAIAASYQRQPSLEKMVQDWGFNESNAGAVNGSGGKVVKTPWGFQDSLKRGHDTRSSVLGKAEWKPNADVSITADVYYEKQAINEPESTHYYQGPIGNWEGGNAANYSKADIRNGYVIGATVTGVEVDNNDNVWVQDSNTLAAGLNGKFKVGDWKLEADLSNSSARRDSAWRSLQQALFNQTFTWSFPGGGVQNYSVTGNTGDASQFAQPWNMTVNTSGHVKDELTALHLNAQRPVEGWGDIERVKFGARATDREKKYHQVSWNVAPKAAIPSSAYYSISNDGMPSFFSLKDFYGTAYNTFGNDVFDESARTPSQGDVLSGWNVKERSASLYAQAELNGQMLGANYRGNFGLRVVRTSHTSGGVQSINGATPTPVSIKDSDTEWLPSLNLVFRLDQQQEHQVRFSAARAMARAPLDELRSSQNLNVGAAGSSQPITGSAGNPALKPMLANQIDLAYQWYFDKGSLLSGGVFFKDMQSYIKVANNPTTIDGKPATITQSVNGEGGQVRGLELVYQQAFTGLPEPFNGLGFSSNYSYTTSNIKESANGGVFPVDGLIKHNGGVVLWYEKAGYEARLSANYHSAFTRNPGWNTGNFWINGAETFVNLNLSRQLTRELQVHFGVENLSNQKVTYTNPNNPYDQQVREFGRRFNLGLTYRM